MSNCWPCVLHNFGRFISYTILHCLELSEKSESGKSVPVDEIYSWASGLTSESHESDWSPNWYVRPDAVSRALRQLDTMSGGIIGLVGLQGVGKSSALLDILSHKRILDREAWREKHGCYPSWAHGDDPVWFKWRRETELFPSLLDGTHEASEVFLRQYKEQLYSRITHLFLQADEDFNPQDLNIDWAEAKLGKAMTKKLREISWQAVLGDKKTILIDTRDYSKTDRRLMAKDLEGIYWLWNSLTQTKSPAKSNLVIAIQKEMFQSHFFFDKMIKIELQPLTPEQMLEAYQKRFKNFHPFTKDALLTLARMSRGIFRRFLRYITLTLDHWTAQPNPRDTIDKETVEEAIPYERLVEDMETELLELFPKQSDLRLQAVQLLMRLSESGPKKQSILAGELGLESYVMSRLLTKLELHHYVTRERDGTDKIVTLTKS